QLGSLLEQVLTPDQYRRNARIGGGTGEFAVCLPGQDDEGGEGLRPIDAKVPHEEYDRPVDAMERGDSEALEAAGRALEQRVRGEAKRISEKYVAPPATTDFAIMFMPTEGLYAEIVRRPGFANALQQQHRILV